MEVGVMDTMKVDGRIVWVMGGDVEGLLFASPEKDAVRICVPGARAAVAKIA
jgi:hypothetical protein